MNRVERQAAGIWKEMIDLDVETLIDGGEPLNADLAPLSAFLTRLQHFADSEVSDEVIKTWGEAAGAMVRARRKAFPSSVDRVTPDRNLPLFTRLRNRATALATSLVMVGGMTGIAVAADGAAPGDLLYGIDRALEAVGIGAGGQQERLGELADSNAGSGVAAGSVPGQAAGDESSVVGAGGERQIGSDRVPAGASSIHTYLESAGTTDGLTVAEMAKLVAELNRQDVGKPGDKGQPDDKGKPDDRGRPEETGRPANTGKP